MTWSVTDLLFLRIRRRLAHSQLRQVPIAAHRYRSSSWLGRRVPFVLGLPSQVDLTSLSKPCERSIWTVKETDIIYSLVILIAFHDRTCPCEKCSVGDAAPVDIQS